MAQPIELALSEAAGGSKPVHKTSEPTKRVLVVEDNPHVSDMLRYSLGRLADKLGTPGSILVAQANDGSEAIRVLRQQPYDLVITDMYMPVLDGGGLLDWIREHAQKTPVLVVSAGGPDARATAQRKGASAFLAKPVRLVEILNQVEKFLSPGTKNS